MDKMTEKALMIVRLSDKAQEIAEHKDDMTTSDYQSCMEAVIIQAIEYGQTLAKKGDYT